MIYLFLEFIFRLIQNSRIGEKVMDHKTSNIENLYKCVRDFRKLGTGRKGCRVLVGDSEDARTCHFNFETTIRHNWPSCNKVEFTNGKTFDTSLQSLGWCKVYIFFWNPLTADLYFRQEEEKKIVAWLEMALPEDAKAMSVLIVEKCGAGCWIDPRPDFTGKHLREIQIGIRMLSLQQLRELTSLIDQRLPTVPVVRDMAA
jgi:hypothetical protein